MLCASIVIVAVLACAEGGYEHRLPGVPFQLANQATLHQGSVQNDQLQTLDRAHYSLPNTHNVLQQHSNGNGYQSDQNYGSVSNGQGSLNGYQTTHSHGTVSNGQTSLNSYQTGQSYGSLTDYQTAQNYGSVSNGQGSLNGYQTTQSHGTVSNVQGSGNSYQIGQNGYSFNANSGSQLVQAGQDYNSGPISTAPVQPVQAIVKKHIYFHVAPPDIEENRATQSIRKTKKTYNIVFIKVPSQQNKYAGNSQLLRNQYAISDTKTLIYVLVKKPESQVYKQTTPNHEVFYVKYKGSPDRVVSQLSGDVSQVNTLRSLQPGLINGQS